ncbi:hypothetical protein [Desulforhopalus singaporensis]|uniref:Uncharacterized protein n=1 Tax=Desulforhopalus singaporensis TaxID=91360 RepID=A0A1H0NTV3_9BACT|nr:hypothetical protein [Desulforhopalus singaporensis]SDO95820.1 hypothetical protein SAMN05660330_01433 [Desulforhopalus singaporensis]
MALTPNNFPAAVERIHELEKEVEELKNENIRLATALKEVQGFPPDASINSTEEKG